MSMEELIKVCVVGTLGVLFAVVVRRHSGELALLLTLAVCAVIAIALVKLAQPVMDFLTKLQRLAGLEQEVMTPLLKAIGIGLLTQIGSAVCADAGETAVSKLIELCGSILALYSALPLLDAVLELITSVSGG